MISPENENVGRNKINYEQTPARLPKGTLARIDAVLMRGEKRSDFLRKAVEEELLQREAGSDWVATTELLKRTPE